MVCNHQRVRCLNSYDTFRKYLCEDCNGVWICECEKEFALAFLPHQTRIATEYGTGERYSVDGFANKLCMTCRGEKEEPHPKAPGYGGKVERYYWREIYMTYLTLARDYLMKNNVNVKDILQFEERFPAISENLRKDARKHWQEVHKVNPKYEIVPGPKEVDFLKEVMIPIREIKAISDGSGKWLNEKGENVSVQEIAAENYRNEGFTVWFNTNNLITIYVATFCNSVIQDRTDPKVRIGMRGSTANYFLNKKPGPDISFLLPEDLGSREYYTRREKQLKELFSKLEKMNSLSTFFDENLEQSKSLRDYLWVNDDYVVEMAKDSLKVIPKSTVISFLDWAIRHFGHRHSGWPNLLLLKSGEYRFSVIKSPKAKLSIDQMQWFRWANEMKIPYELCRVIKKT
jgi:hypothetical protein